MLRTWSRPVSLVVSFLVVAGISACSSPGGGNGPGGDDDDDGATATPTPTATPAGVHLTSDTTWSGTVAVDENTIVDAGVTLTIDPGSTVNFAGAKRLSVAGTLVANGTMGAPIALQAAVPASKWQGIHALSGGSVALTHVTLANATTGFVADTGAMESALLYATFTAVGQPFDLSADTRICRATFSSGNSYFKAGAISIADSDFTGGSGDTFNFSSSSADITLDHVHMGTNWHCLLHGGGASASVTITASAFEDAAYLFMSSTLTASMHGSSILLESGDQLIDVEDGSGNTIDATGNYWGTANGTFEASSQTVPAGWNVSGALSTAPANAGPRAGAGCEATF